MLLSAGVLLAWVWLGAGFGLALWIKAGVAVFLWLLCAVSAWCSLQRQPKGYLHWNGQAWTWQSQSFLRSLSGAPVVALDLQWLLLLHWRDDQGRSVRFVLQSDWGPQAWGDMRRAVYSSVHPVRDATNQPER